jgi:hypothetical protein
VRWRLAAASALAAAACVALATGALAQTGDAENDAPEGTSALRQLADARGHRSDLMRNNFQPARPPGVLFVIGPEITFKPGDAEELVRWIESGGVLVYAGTTPDGQLEQALGISRADSSPTFDAFAQASAAAPLLAGVGIVRTGVTTAFNAPTGGQVAFLRANGDHRPVGIEGPLGRGHFFAFASASVFDNQTIGVDDNGALAADLLASAGPAAPAIFDQYHHAGGAGESSSLGWLFTSWGFAILLEVLLVFGLLALSGRAFGPRIPLRPVGDPSSAEFTSAVGAMLRRAHARQQTMARLMAATRAALAEQVGIRHGADPERLESVLRQRWPALADALGVASSRAAAVHDERSLAQAAAELHDLAHPALGDRAQNTNPTRRKN